MRSPLLRTALRPLGALVVLLGLVSCDKPTSPLSPMRASRTTLVTQPTLDAEVRALVTAGFPKGQATAILANWDQVVRTAASTPKVTLKGKQVPGSQGRSALTRTIAMVDARAKFATPPAGETTPHFLARIVLDMSLYVYGGAGSPVPAIDPGSDVTYKLVQGATTDTIVTPALQAAAIFPAGAVQEPTVVVVTPDSVYYPANCSGPLDTHLCQYPRFYRFNVFPDVKLAVPAKVQVCHVDAGSNRLPLADHDRFRIAHDKPASPSDYSAGSTIVDNVEILALTSMTVTSCQAGGGTTYTPPTASRGGLGALAGRALAFARRLLTPSEAYAIDVGGGGLVEIFSSFGVVDPQSVADLAQSTAAGTYFAPLMTTQVQGGTITTTSWNVTNRGSGTSGAFTSSVVLASDSLLTNPISTVLIGGGASLVPSANFNYAAQSVTIPTTLAPGDYFLGTRVFPTGADSSASDDLVSFRITVNASAPAIADVALLPFFTVSSANVMQGGSLTANAFSIKNVGGMVSSPFDSRVVIATDTMLTNAVWTYPVDNATVLTAGTLLPHTSTLVQVSPCTAPGSYFVGARVYPSGPDASATNDAVSARVNVTSAPAPSFQSAGSAAWTGAGPGVLTEKVQPHCATLQYNHTPSNSQYADEQWTFTTTAVSTGAYTFVWTYDGLHSWFQSHQALEAFADGPNGTATIQLVGLNYLNTGNGFNFSGSATLPLTAGYNWGVRPSGGHFDLSQILLGTVTIIDPTY